MVAGAGSAAASAGPDVTCGQVARSALKNHSSKGRKTIVAMTLVLDTNVALSHPRHQDLWLTTNESTISVAVHIQRACALGECKLQDLQDTEYDQAGIFHFASAAKTRL